MSVDEPDEQDFLITPEQRVETASDAENDPEEAIRVGTISARARLAEKQRETEDSEAFKARMTRNKR